MTSPRKKRIILGLMLTAMLVLGFFMYPHEKTKVGGKAAIVTDTEGHHRKGGTAAVKTADKAPQPALPVKTPPSAAPPPVPGDNPYIAYPDKILDILGIDKEAVARHRDEFKKTVVHVEWMARLNEVLADLDPEKKAAMIDNHTAHLYIKELLNEAYLSGKIDHDTFVKAVADLMKWHQSTYVDMLSPEEYEALFEVKPEAAEGLIDELLAATPRYSFITNQSLPADEIAKQVQGYKLEQVDAHFKKMILTQETISKKIDKGEMTPEQARAAMNKSQAEFIARCRELLTEDEIATVFGSLEALESGKTETEGPMVQGDEDIAELGFMIENPATSVEMVKAGVDKEKREDVKFFYQEWYREKEALIARLDAGEIQENVFENLSNEMDRTLAENCRSVLTDAEYRLIFDREGGTPAAQTSAAGSEKTQPAAVSPEK